MSKKEIREEIRFWALFSGHKILDIDIDEYIIITSVSENGFVYSNILKEDNGILNHIESISLN